MPGDFLGLRPWIFGGREDLPHVLYERLQRVRCYLRHSLSPLCSGALNLSDYCGVGATVSRTSTGTRGGAPAGPAQGRSNTLPHSPCAIRSMARSNSSSGKRCVMMGEGSSRPDCKKRAALYQVAKIWRPVMP